MGRGTTKWWRGTLADTPDRQAARDLRKRLTPPEARLWFALKGEKLEGVKFRRQHPIGPYVLDFDCARARLAVEVDGEGHDHPDQIAADRRRTAWLEAQGAAVIRFTAEAVRVSLEEVLEAVLEAVRKRTG